MDAAAQDADRSAGVDTRIAALEARRGAAPAGDRRHPRRDRRTRRSTSSGHKARLDAARKRPARPREGPRGRPGQAQQERGPALRGQDQQGILRGPRRDRGDQAGEGPHRGGDPRPHGDPGAARRRHQGRRGALQAARGARARARRPPLQEQLRAVETDLAVVRSERARAGPAAPRAVLADYDRILRAPRRARRGRGDEAQLLRRLPHDHHAPAAPGAARAERR